MTTNKFYEYLLEKHFGEANGVTKDELSEELGMSKRELRYMTKEINEDMRFEKVISVSKKCYICENADEAIEAIRKTYKAAISLLKKAKRMEKKVSLNGQIKLGSDEQSLVEWVETFCSGDKK